MHLFWNVNITSRLYNNKKNTTTTTTTTTTTNDNNNNNHLLHIYPLHYFLCTIWFVYILVFGLLPLCCLLWKYKRDQHWPLSQIPRMCTHTTELILTLTAELFRTAHTHLQQPNVARGQSWDSEKHIWSLFDGLPLKPGMSYRPDVTQAPLPGLPGPGIALTKDLSLVWCVLRQFNLCSDAGQPGRPL